MASLLEVDSLQVRYSVRSDQLSISKLFQPDFIEAVCDVSFQIKEAETFALVGESGSGKTTLAFAVAGLVKASRGSIRFEGQELAGLPSALLKRRRRDIAMMFQDPIGSLSPRLSVKSLITEPFKIHGLSDRNLDSESKRLLEMVGLTVDFESRYPHQLSGGQARRVGVARALALSPKLIIADEPTAGLDVSVQGEILNLLGQLKRELEISLLIISHNLSIVRHVADRMAIMYMGRFVEEGDTETIFSGPRHPYSLALLKATPEPDPDVSANSIQLLGEIPSLMARPKGCEFHTRCPYAKAVCQTEPPHTQFVMSDHRLTCHFPLTAPHQGPLVNPAEEP